MHSINSPPFYHTRKNPIGYAVDGRFFEFKSVCNEDLPVDYGLDFKV